MNPLHFLTATKAEPERRKVEWFKVLRFFNSLLMGNIDINVYYCGCKYVFLFHYRRENDGIVVSDNDNSYVVVS